MMCSFSSLSPSMGFCHDKEKRKERKDDEMRREISVENNGL